MTIIKSETNPALSMLLKPNDDDDNNYNNNNNDNNDNNNTNTLALRFAYVQTRRPIV